MILFLGSCKSCLVIDTGYSFTHIVPYIKGEKYLPGIRRIDVGGKVNIGYRIYADTSCFLYKYVKFSSKLLYRYLRII